MIKLLLIVCCLWVSLALQAIEPIHFESTNEEIRFKELIYELRCLQCQNQNLADSNSELAQDLRREILKLMREGNSNVEIKTFLVDRYTDFILYRTPFNFSTAMLWLGPPIFILGGFFFLIRFQRDGSKYSPASPNQSILDKIIDDSKDEEL